LGGGGSIFGTIRQTVRKQLNNTNGLTPLVIKKKVGGEESYRRRGGKLWGGFLWGFL